MKVRGEWFVFMDHDGDPHVLLRKTGGGEERIPSKEECEFACQVLNEEGSNVIRLVCRTEGCKDKGGWIERGRADAAKTVYHCQMCGKAMER